MTGIGTARDLFEGDRRARAVYERRGVAPEALRDIKILG
jgi:hypothetical protein